MSLKNRPQRSAEVARDQHNDDMAVKAAAVGEAVFTGSPPNAKCLQIRTAIGLNFVILCGKHIKGGVDLDRAVSAVKAAAVEYDEKRDGQSDMMRWWGDVKRHRVLEEMLRRGTETQSVDQD